MTHLVLKESTVFYRSYFYFFLANEFTSKQEQFQLLFYFSIQEIASILIAFSRHKEWLKMEMKIRPPSGSMLLYSRNRVRYRKDGYCWKKRKDGKNIREDHMKLKVQGLEVSVVRLLWRCKGVFLRVGLSC